MEAGRSELPKQQQHQDVHGCLKKPEYLAVIEVTEK